MIQKYLNEDKLGDIINTENQWVHNKNFLRYKIRPDYRNDLTKEVVEFDGFRHYSQASVVIKDKEKDKIYKKEGYKVIRIPYFVQASSDVFSTLFNRKFNITQIYPHGFIDSKALLPCDFCELGIERFKEDLSNFRLIREDILKSIQHKIQELGNPLLVLPKSLLYLMEEI